MRLIPNFFGITWLLIISSISTLAFPVGKRDIVPATHSILSTSIRSTNTCADPSLAHPLFQAFSGEDTAHLIHFHFAIVNSNSRQRPGPAFWTTPQGVFNAWPTQQPSTVPLFHLITPTNSDAIYAVGADALTPPVVSGFGSPVLIAWVYNTTDCGGMPLMGAALPSATDHYYTMDPFEHAGLLSEGWIDTGVAAFVLPSTKS